MKKYLQNRGTASVHQAFSNTSINLLACIAGEKIKGNFPVLKKNKQTKP